MKKLIFFILGITFLNTLNPILLYTFASSNQKYVIQAGVFQDQSNADKIYSKENPNNINSFQQAIKEETNTSKEIKSKNYHLNEDVTVDGIFGSHIFFIDINKYWQVKSNAYLELIFSQSQIKNYKNSTLTIEVNNSPVHSVLLYDKGVNRERIKVPIPLDKIREGFNEVKIKVYHRITDEPCTDIINPGNWIVFHKDSYVHIEFVEKVDSLSLSDYPYPYFKKNNDEPINNMIIVPDNFQSYEINAAMIFAANFGQRSRYSKLNINISKFSEADKKDKNNIIYIGSRNNTPQEILSLISEEEIKLTSDKALIKEVESPYNSNYKILLILSNDEKSILKAVKALASDKMVLQMDKSYQFIPNTLNMNEVNLPESEYIFFEDLGYSNVKLEGIFYQKATFGVNIPKDWVVKEGSLLYIDMRYSEVLNFERSVLTAYLNDVPIGSKKLNYENANNDVFEIKIPKEVRDDDYYNIKIVFYLELNSEDCDYRRDSNSWAYISNQSYLYLPHEQRNDSFFENYESPFITNKKFNDLLIVVPENLSSYEMRIVGNIVSALGRNVNSLENIKVTTSKESADEFKDKNLIIIGTPNKNNLIKAINDQLYIKFDKDFNRFLSNEKMTLLDDYNNNLASLQMLKSPFDESKKALIITAIKDEGLNWASEFLTDFQLLSRLRGNAVVIGKSGNIQWQYFETLNDKEMKKPINEEDKKQDIKRVITSKQVRNYIIFVIAILVFIIVSSILIMRKKR